MRPSAQPATSQSESAVSADSTLIAELRGSTSGDGFRWEPPDKIILTNRYADRGPLGQGGQAFVRRAYDTLLDREVAVKILWPRLARTPEASLRFLREARVTAQLDHPGIVTLHDTGHLDAPLRLPYQVLSIIDWRTLDTALHRDRLQGVSGPARLRHRISILARVADAVGYAHSRGIVHRDLKPANIALGEHGEVVVLDWGLAGQVSAEDGCRPLTSGAPRLARGLTRLGAIRGTPLYMSPEQASGGQVGPASDVYALGAMLYDLACGRPVSGRSTESILVLVKEGGLRPLEQLQVAPADIARLCRRCLDANPRERPASATEVAIALRAWLDGQAAEDRARACLARAADHSRELKRLQVRRRKLEQTLQEVHGAVPDWAPAAQKRHLWKLQDEVSDLDQAAALQAAERNAALSEALTHAPDLPEAHARLADLARMEHEEARAAGQRAAATAALTRLRRHDRAGHHAAYLSGRGHLSVAFDGPLRSLTLHRLIEVDRRLLPSPGWGLPPAGVQDLRLPAGSWSLRATTPDGLSFDLPVELPAGRRWSGDLHGEEVTPVHVPRAQEVPPGCRYVAGGPCWSGGDPLAYGDALPLQRQWVDGFAIQTLPVRAGDYVAFLNRLVAAGRTEEAERWAPQERTSSAQDAGPAILGRRSTGQFYLTYDGDGDLWLPDWPIVLIDVPAMEAYARLLSEQTGHRWQLPWELQWEKAARGTDRRAFPWGSHFDATFCSNSRSHAEGVTVPPEVTGFPDDCSPYGVRFMAGGVTEVCRDGFTPSGPQRLGRTWAPGLEHPRGRVGRGGAYSAAAGKARVCFRTHIDEDVRAPALGFRLAVPVGPQHSPH
jgi:serine/threonine-protein kinase